MDSVGSRRSQIPGRLLDGGREMRKLLGFLGTSDEQVLRLLSLSLHPLRLLSIAGKTGPTRFGREAGDEEAQAVSHSEERIASRPLGDKQRCLMARMRPDYIARADPSMRREQANGPARQARACRRRRFTFFPRRVQKKGERGRRSALSPIDSPTGATGSRPQNCSVYFFDTGLSAGRRDVTS